MRIPFPLPRGGFNRLHDAYRTMNTPTGSNGGLHRQTSAARSACLLVFLVCGIGLSAWAPMVPLVKTALRMDEATLGFVLLSLGAGSLTLMPFTGILINRWGSRRVMLAAAVCISLTLPALLLASSVLRLALTLYIFGAAIGGIDVAMNAHAVSVQDRAGRHIMSSFHGMFSLGGLAGAIGMSFLIKSGFPPVWAATGISLLLLAISISQYGRLLPHTEEQSVEVFRFRWSGGPVLLLGVMCFVVFLAEGALLDWSAVFLQFYRDVDPAMSGAGYAVFSTAMAVSRFTGDRLIRRIGPRRTVIHGSVLAASGYFLAIFVPWSDAALAGFFLVGLGAANIVPVFFTAAGRIPGIPATAALPAVTTLGYSGQLAGPALIGFIAEISSLGFALGLVGLLMLLVGLAYKYRGNTRTFDYL